MFRAGRAGVCALLTVWPVLALEFQWKAQDNLWEFLARGGTEIANLERSGRDRCRALVRKYRDLSKGMADAAPVSREA